MKIFTLVLLCASLVHTQIRTIQPQDAAAEYDLVILDSPPLPGFPEPLQMAAPVDGELVVNVEVEPEG